MREIKKKMYAYNAIRQMNNVEEKRNLENGVPFETLSILRPFCPQIVHGGVYIYNFLNRSFPRQYY